MGAIVKMIKRTMFAKKKTTFSAITNTTTEDTDPPRTPTLLEKTTFVAITHLTTEDTDTPHTPTRSKKCPPSSENEGDNFDIVLLTGTILINKNYDEKNDESHDQDLSRYLTKNLFLREPFSNDHRKYAFRTNTARNLYLSHKCHGCKQAIYPAGPCSICLLSISKTDCIIKYSTGRKGLNKKILSWAHSSCIRRITQ